MENVLEVIMPILGKYCFGTLTKDSDLFQSGLNSLNTIKVLIEIEKYYHFKFLDNELDISDLKTAANLAAFVQKKIEEEQKFCR